MICRRRTVDPPAQARTPPADLHHPAQSRVHKPLTGGLLTARRVRATCFAPGRWIGRSLLLLAPPPPDAPPAPPAPVASSSPSALASSANPSSVAVGVAPPSPSRGLESCASSP
eukprot:CAMPEP_0182548118 /NCGR_PEP_ID=MMETSP1323-20130603/38381_1 /TAXON_ID=236787 /ORGANISM="Florenciella parvula, Strain RCC1693" /LENGTH=113 /DNA_ID=CAMNT_0024759485 /DNA_START=68 /DNA_END=409 /DNA_ORIENTATION=-